MIPNELIEDISFLTASIYAEIETAILEEIAMRLKDLKDEPNFKVNMLADMGGFTENSIKIIAEHTKESKKTLKISLENLINHVLHNMDTYILDVDAVNRSAIAKHVQKLSTWQRSGHLSPLYADILQRYATEISLKTERATRTMLNRAMAQYIKTANTIERIDEQINFTLAKAGLNVNTKAEAVQQTLRTINENGINAFVDRAGRKWGAREYINMVVRTNTHNMAVDTLFTRSKEYGTGLIMTSSHAGARPLCFPYQNQVFSINGMTGYTTDGNGVIHHFTPLESTTYGQPAGLFGINCGHRPYPFFTNSSLIRPNGTMDETENAKEFKLSQVQRRIEREYRQAKREVKLMILADLDTTKSKERAKRIKMKYKAFTEKTGRTPRPDRLKI